MRRLDTGWRLSALALGWLAGVALQLQQAELLAAAPYLAAIVVGALGVLAVWRWRVVFGPGVGAVAAALLAWGVAGQHATRLLDDALPTALEGTDIVVSGVVASLPQQSAAGLRFRFSVEAAALDGHPVRVPEHLALGWYRGFHEDATLTQPQRELRAGQRWRFTVRLRQPHGNLNPSGFDYELSLFEQGLRATGYVRDAPQALLHLSAGFPVERLRQRVRDAIYASVPDRRAAGVLAALAVGDQGAIERDDWDLFRNTGVAHLMSISGLHVTMFAWLAGLALGALWRRSERLALRLPAPSAGAWAGVFAAFGYALFSGWGVPAQRTVWMLGSVALLRLLGVRWPLPLVLLTAAVVVTAFDPWALLQAGFWLSFMAVGLLMASAPQDRSPADTSEPLDGASALSAVEPAWRRWPRRLLIAGHGELRSQVIATLGLAPLTLVFFQQVSVVAFAAKKDAIPFVTLVITPLALLGAVVPGLWTLGAGCVAALTTGLGWLAAFPVAVWNVAVAPAWAQLGGLLGAALLVMPLPWRARLLAVPLVLPLLVPPRELPAEGGFDIVAADVGQGTSVLIRTRSHVLVYDAGPQYSRDSDAGQRVVVPLLRARGDAHIDRLVLSHRDLDHVGGTRAIFAALPVDELLTSLEPAHPLRALARVSRRCEAGQTWSWDGVRFDVLSPPAAAYAQPAKSNAMSCVVRVAGSRRSVLLAGDIERDQERELVGSLGAQLKSDVLVVPHHGSRTSSTAAFIESVQPQIALFQAGYRNRFGHPAPDVVARYRERGVAMFASASCGAWLWPDGAALPGGCQREIGRRYWRHRPEPP